MSDWEEIGRKHGTDKVELGYLPHYQQLLQDHDVSNVLEIGVLKGASLATWHDIWPDARIVGVDVNAPSMTLDPSIQVVIGDGRDPAVMNCVDGSFDLIVDDSDHFLDTVRQVMANCAYRLSPKGLYVVEDTLIGRTPQSDRPLLTIQAKRLMTDCGLTPFETYETRSGTFAMVVGRRQ